MFQRQVRMQVNISDITENSAELGTVHAITFTLLSGMLKIEKKNRRKKSKNDPCHLLKKAQNFLVKIEA